MATGSVEEAVLARYVAPCDVPLEIGAAATARIAGFDMPHGRHRLRLYRSPPSLLSTSEDASLEDRHRRSRFVWYFDQFGNSFLTTFV